MLASAVKREDDIHRLTAEVRRAYRMLREIPIPTIAAIRGACFGCGIELSLQCDFRVASDDFATQFWMTEISEYLFIPCFGGTQELPRLVGLEGATDLVLWGRRWNGPEALREGLVDAVVDLAGFDANVDAFVAGTLAERRRTRTLGYERSSRESAFAERTRRRIEALPAAIRGAYRECFELLELASRTPPGDPGGYERERSAAARTLLEPASKRAQSFFFVRQSAEALAGRGHTPPGRWEIRLAGHPELAAELRAANIGDVAVIDPLTAATRDAADGARRLAIASPDSREAAPDVLLDLASHGDARRPEPQLPRAWAPFWSSGVPLVEIALPLRPTEAHAAASRARDTYDVLARAGFRGVISRPRDRFALEDILHAWTRPLLAFLDCGGTPHDAASTLHHIGFTRGPAAMAAMLFDRPLLRPFLDATPERGIPRPELADAILLSLLDAARTLLGERVLAHPSAVDLLVREALDFPIALGSLCRYLTPSLTGEILDRAHRTRSLTTPAMRESARRHATEGRPFYA
jgi:enoyl-CoA hydratase/carnithine racemase